MNSPLYVEKGGYKMLAFEEWMPMASIAVSNMPKYGDISCVYAMRCTNTGDLAYIGSTANLRRRIFGNYLGGVGGETTQRIHDLLFVEGWIAEVELGWLETDEYKDKEGELKMEYYNKYGRLPKWDRQF